jgi:hypothetical protein
MLPSEEAAFEAKAEKYFRSHRDAPNGRNFLAFQMRFHGGSVADNYAMGICRTFPEAPGSRMCGACNIEGCDMRYPARREDYQWVVDRIKAACPDDEITLQGGDFEWEVTVMLDNGRKGPSRKRWMFFVKTDRLGLPAHYNLHALPRERQESVVDEQIALLKKFKERQRA